MNMMLCYILCCTQPYKDVLVTSYISNICNLLDYHIKKIMKMHQGPVCRDGFTMSQGP